MSETVEQILKDAAARLAPVILRDPRPPAVIRFSGIGRRRIEPASRAAVAATLERMFRHSSAAAQAALAEPEIAAQFRGGPELVLISPLAEGGDRAVARAALECGLRLGAVLPFDPATYEATFDLDDPTSAAAEFRVLLAAAALPEGYGVLSLDGDPSPGKVDEAYLDCARTVTRWCEIMVAILGPTHWTSQTGLSVREALGLGAPVVVIDPERPETFSLLSGESVLEGEAAKAGLSGIIRQYLAPAASARSGREGGRLPGRLLSLLGAGESRGRESDLEAYVAEPVAFASARECDFEQSGPCQARTQCPDWARWCAGLNGAVERAVRRAFWGPSPGAPAWPWLWDLPLEPEAAPALAALYLRHHRADMAASAYAGLYRSAQILVVSLGVLTAVFAVSGAFIQGWGGVFAVLELASLLPAVSLAFVAHGQAWLDRWLDYRLLAEVFRYSKFTLLTGRPSPFADARDALAAEVDRPWTRAHAVRVLRACPLAVPGRGAQPAEDAPARVAAYVRARCVEDQLRYHRRSSREHRALAAALRTAGGWIAAATLLVVSIKAAMELGVQFGGLSVEAGLEPVRKLLEALAIALPALTAALFAFLAYGEHGIVAHRSEDMTRALETAGAQLEKPLTLMGLGDAAVDICRLLLREVDGWLDLFTGKEL